VVDERLELGVLVEARHTQLQGQLQEAGAGAGAEQGRLVPNGSVRSRQNR
jgi:hypothetical protein